MRFKAFKIHINGILGAVMAEKQFYDCLEWMWICAVKLFHLLDEYRAVMGKFFYCKGGLDEEIPHWETVSCSGGK